jgi:hypothetical protein
LSRQRNVRLKDPNGRLVRWVRLREAVESVDKGKAEWSGFDCVLLGPRRSSPTSITASECELAATGLPPSIQKRGSRVQLRKPEWPSQASISAAQTKVLAWPTITDEKSNPRREGQIPESTFRL